MEIPHEKQFHFHDGTAVGSIEQLKNKIETISYQEFYRHVNAEKNDFSNWVRYVLKDERLADDLQKVGSIVETVELLEDYSHPRPTIASHRDIQSRIEADVIKSPLPTLEDNSPMTIEQVPSSAPRQSPSGHVEPIDLRVIEEKLGLRSDVDDARPPSVQPKDLMSDTKVREELFGTEQKAREQLDAEYGRENVRDTTRSEERSGSSTPSAYDADTTRLIVKDFIYGLIFGLVLGIILGRIISM